MDRITLVRAAAIGSAMVLLAVGVRADRFELQKLAQRGDSVGGDRTLLAFRESAIDGDTIIFHALLAGGGEGIYRLVDGAPHTLVDTFTAVPGGVGNFVSFRFVRLAGEYIVFQGNAANEQQGIYRIDLANGVVERAADRSTPIPAGEGTFSGLQATAVDASGTVIFDAFGESNSLGRRQAGIYLWHPNTGVTRVIDLNQVVPAIGEPFYSANFPAVEGPLLCFYGAAPSLLEPAIDLYVMGNVMPLPLVTTGQPVPDLDGYVFSNFGTFTAVRDMTVAFMGESLRIDNPAARRYGYYTATAGGVTTLVATDAVDPCTGQPIVGFDNGPAFDEGEIVFRGRAAIYTTLGGSGGVRRVVATGGLLEGGLISGVDKSTQAISGSTILFNASWYVGFATTSGLWSATLVPGPVTGDVNEDGTVNLTDLATLLTNFGVPTGATAAQGDTDGNGTVDLIDLAQLLTYYGYPC